MAKREGFSCPSTHREHMTGVDISDRLLEFGPGLRKNVLQEQRPRCQTDLGIDVTLVAWMACIGGLICWNHWMHLLTADSQAHKWE